MGTARGQDRMNEGMCLKTTSERKSMFATDVCKEVKSFIFWAQRREKRERQMKVELYCSPAMQIYM